jgi:hypothetical protein
MSFSTSGIGTTHTLAPSSSSPAHQYSSVKRCHSAQPSLSTSAADLKELINTLFELNNHFKKNFKILTEIKDQIAKVCEKQEARPVDDNSGIHKLERVCINLKIIRQLIQDKMTFFLYHED